jgi:lysophospholipase L1-like esterase
MTDRSITAVALRAATGVAGVLLGAAFAESILFARSIRRAYAFCERAERYERSLPNPRRRLLLVGDSTAVGLGSSSLHDTIAGRIGNEFPDVSIENHAQLGARAASVVEQLRAVEGRFDAVLIAVGGNDIIRGTPADKLRESLELALVRARELAPLVIVANCANVGGAPLFGWPLNIVLERRSFRARAIFASTCRRSRATFVNFTVPRRRDQFINCRNSFYAEDGLHPSNDAYGYCYTVLKRRTKLTAMLNAA